MNIFHEKPHILKNVKKDDPIVQENTLKALANLSSRGKSSIYEPFHILFFFWKHLIFSNQANIILQLTATTKQKVVDQGWIQTYKQILSTPQPTENKIYISQSIYNLLAHSGIPTRKFQFSGKTLGSLIDIFS